MDPTSNVLKIVIAAAAIAASGVLQAGQAVPTPPPGEIWVYPTGVFPDDFHALWMAVNGAPYAAGDLPIPFPEAADGDPGARPVFVGQPQPS